MEYRCLHVSMAPVVCTRECKQPFSILGRQILEACVLTELRGSIHFSGWKTQSGVMHTCACIALNAVSLVESVRLHAAACTRHDMRTHLRTYNAAQVQT